MSKHNYEIEIDWQTPEQRRIVDELLNYGLWGKEESIRKAPHTLHHIDYEVDEPLTKEEVAELRRHMTKVYSDGGYVILGIKIVELL